MHDTRDTNVPATMARWLARLGGIVIVLFGALVSMLVANPPVSGNPHGTGYKAFIAVMTCALPLVGTVMGWVKPRLGAIAFGLVAALAVGFAMTRPLAEGESRFPLAAMLMLPPLIVAALFTFAGMLGPRTKGDIDAPATRE